MRSVRIYSAFYAKCPYFVVLYNANQAEKCRGGRLIKNAMAIE